MMNLSMFIEQSEINKSLELSSCPWLANYRFQQSALIERWKLCGFFQDQDFLDINCHWLQFEPAPLVNHLILVCIFILILLIGCLCNVIAVYILASSRHLRTPANIIIMNLAISDFFMLIKMPIFLYNSLLQGPALGNRGCEIYGFLSGLTGTTSIMSLAAVAVDRYLVISHPLKVDKKPTRTRAYVTVVFIWFYSTVFASMPLFGVSKYVPEGYLTSCSFDYLSDDNKTRIFILSFFVAAWVVPFLIITSCYIAIFWYVRKVRMEFERQQWNQHIDLSVIRNCSAGLRQTKIELMIAKISMALISLWMASWTPYAFVALLGITGNRLSPGMTMLPALFAKLSACINPIVYTLSHPKIRKELFRRWYTFMSSRSSVQFTNNVSPGPEEPEAVTTIHPNGYFRRDTYSRSRQQQLISMVNLSEPCIEQDNHRNPVNETCLSISASVALATYAHGTASLYRYSPQQDETNRSEPSTELVTSINSTEAAAAQTTKYIVPYTIGVDLSNNSL